MGDGRFGNRPYGNDVRGRWGDDGEGRCGRRMGPCMREDTGGVSLWGQAMRGKNCWGGRELHEAGDF